MTDGSNLQEGSSAGRKAVRISLTFDDFRSFITQYSSHISMGGMFIGTRSPLPPGTLCKLDVKLKDGYSIVSGLGEVVWTRERSEGPERPPGMGVRFRELEDKSKDLIFAIVDRRLVEGSAADSSPAVPGAASEEIPDLEELLRTAGKRREEAESRLTPPASGGPIEAAIPEPVFPVAMPSQQEEKRKEKRGQQLDLLPSVDDLGTDSGEASFGDLLDPAPEDPDFESPAIESPTMERQYVDRSGLEDAPSSDLGEMADSLGETPASDAALDSRLLSELGVDESGLPAIDSLEKSHPVATPSGWPEPKSQQLPPLELPPLESLLGIQEDRETSSPLPELPLAAAPSQPSGDSQLRGERADVLGSLQEEPPKGLEDVWSRLDELEEVSRERSLDPGALSGSQREALPSSQAPPKEVSSELLDSMEALGPVEGLEAPRSDKGAIADEIELPRAAVDFAGEQEDLSDVPPWQGDSEGYYASQPRRSKALWWLIPVILVLLAALAWAMGLLPWPQASSSSEQQQMAASSIDETGRGEGSIAEDLSDPREAEPTEQESSQTMGSDSSALTSPEVITPDIEPSTLDLGSSGTESEGGSSVDDVPGASATIPPPTPPPAEPIPRTPMTRVTDIGFQESEGSTRLVITTNGRIDDGRFKYVRISSGSPRLLVRLIGIEQGYPQVTVPVSTSEVQQVRVGFHPDRGRGELHVVVDLAKQRVQAKSVERQGAKLVVILE